MVNKIVPILSFVTVLSAQNAAVSSYLDPQHGDAAIDVRIREVRMPKIGDTTGTYWCTLGYWTTTGSANGSTSGYGGMQYTTDMSQGPRNYIYSQWNDYSTSAYNDPATQVKTFGGEGTGVKSINNDPANQWKRDYWHVTADRVWNEGANSYFAYIIRNGETGVWRHVMTWKTPEANLKFKGAGYQFIEDWGGDGLYREGNYRKGWIRKSGTKGWVPNTIFRYSVNGTDIAPGGRSYNKRTNWACGKKSDASGDYLYMAAGGTVACTNNNGAELTIPRTEKSPQEEYGTVGISTVTATVLAGGKLEVKWANDAKTVPQWSYTITIKDGADVIASLAKSDTIPEKRADTIVISSLTPASKKYTAVLEITDFFDGKASKSAEFGTVSAQTYALTVTGGTGDGSYESGKSVAITAEVPAGKTFVKWSSADGVVFADPTKASTTITMLGKACTVTAEFKDASTATYALTVTGGTGDGSYESGKSVAITAEVPAGKEFVKWSSADGVVFADPTKASTTITMLGKACTVTAEFKSIAVVLDTSNLSVNLVEFGSWSISADELGSKAVLDSSAQGKNQISADFTVIAGDDAKEIYPWTSMTASFDTAFDNSTLFKVKYSSNNRIRMVLVQGILGDSGVAFGYELPAADTTLYLKKEQFAQPDWTPDSLKAVLDLKTVTDISFESVKTGTASKITITELKASNYTVKKETAVLNREKMNLSSVMVNGSQVTISRQIQNPVVRVFGFNGRVLAERSAGGSELNLSQIGLSSGVYAVQVIGKDFQSPAMRCIVK